MDQLVASVQGAIPYLAAFLIGFLVGMTELIGRYRDEPFKASRSRPAVAYMTVNGAASVIVLAAAVAFGWNFGMDANSPQATLVRVVAAGLSAMAILRTSLFTVHVADTEVGIGPVAILQVLLVAIDAGVDRVRAEQRSTATGQIMSGLQFSVVSEALPTYALALMQNLSPDDQKKLGTQVGQLVGSKMDDRLKVLILGLLVMNAVGEDVLRSAVTSIRKEIPDAVVPGSTPVPERGGFLGRVKRQEERPASSVDPVGAVDPAVAAASAGTPGSVPPVG
jgi:hypothetical protein